jgi:hypothetical protein
MDEPAKRIIDLVLGRLGSDTGRILAKAEWLRVYWNETVATNGVFARIEPGITPRYTSRGPTVMYRQVVGGAYVEQSGALMSTARDVIEQIRREEFL